MLRFQEFTSIYTYQPFAENAKHRALCEKVMTSPELYKEISNSMRVILPQLPATAEARDKVIDSLRYRVPVYFGSLQKDMFYATKYKELIGLTATQALKSIDTRVRYAICGRVLATKGRTAKTFPAYVAHAYGVNLESTSTADYKVYVDAQTGRLRRDLFQQAQDQLAALLVTAGLHARDDARARRATVLVPGIGMGSFLSAFSHEGDKKWAYDTFVQALATTFGKEAHHLDVVFYGDERATRVKARVENDTFRVVVMGDLFADAAKHLSDDTSRTLLVINAWDNVSFVGNGMLEDETFDGKIASGVAEGVSFGNSCFTHNTYLMPCVLEPKHWIDVNHAASNASDEDIQDEDEEQEEQEDDESKDDAPTGNQQVRLSVGHEQYLTSAPQNKIPSSYRGADEGLKGIVVVGDRPAVWTLAEDGHLVNADGLAWDVFEDEAESVDFVFLWRRASSDSLNQRFTIDASGHLRFGKVLGLYVDTYKRARFTADKRKWIAVKVMRTNAAAEQAPKAAAAASAATDDTTAWFKEVPDKLPYSLFYLSKDQASMLRKHAQLKQFLPHLPCWVSHRFIAQVMYGDDAAVKQAERVRGPWVWAPQFNNVHQTWKVIEPTITIDGVHYPGGCEVYFQLMKYKGTPAFAKAIKALKPATSAHIDGMKAWEVGQRWKARADWFAVRSDVMKQGVRAKFTDFAMFKQLLQSTGTHPLVQIKPGDAFWGTGTDGRGNNELGVILEQIRSEY